MNERPFQKAGLPTYDSFCTFMSLYCYCPLERASGGFEDTGAPPFHRSGVAEAAPKGGRNESGIPQLTGPGSSGALLSTPLGILSARALGCDRRQRLEGPPHQQRCSLPSPTSPGGSPKPPCLVWPGIYGREQPARAPGHADTRRGSTYLPLAEGRSGAGGRGPGRPVTFRTTRPLPCPPPRLLSANRHGSDGPPGASAFPWHPPRAPAPRPLSSARLVPAGRAGGAAPPSSRGLGLRAPGDGAGPRMRTDAKAVRAQLCRSGRGRASKRTRS